MGTTLEAALIRGSSCLVSHTGDSRVYAINENGIRQVTKDHSYVNVLLKVVKLRRKKQKSSTAKLDYESSWF